MNADWNSPSHKQEDITGLKTKVGFEINLLKRRILLESFLKAQLKEETKC
jgi:hypothetical protein